MQRVACSRLLRWIVPVFCLLQADLTPAAAQASLRLEVPPLAVDDHSIVLVWRKPADYARVVDYRILMNGRPIGSANENAQRFSRAAPYAGAFYAAYRGDRQVRVSQHSYTVDGLRPDTVYRFSVRAVYADGRQSEPGPVLVQRTTRMPVHCDITAHGAIADGRTLNTSAIQDTITACPAGGTVYVPAGVFKTGALFLKSDMTLEVSEGATLLGSERAEDYPPSLGYRLYSYSTTQRPPSLINALDRTGRMAGTFRNIRIVGKGRIDGNGWVRATEASVRDDTGSELPHYAFGTNATYRKLGILAASQVDQALSEGLSLNAAYSQRRSSLITLRGVENLYVSGVTLLNPAFHGLMVLESENAAINGVRITTFDANNADGIEFGNSEHVLVFNSFFDTGDDCVAFAAGTGEDAAIQKPQSDAWVFGNYMRHGHGTVVIGSHTGAWIEDVLAEDNIANLTWIGLRAKSNNLNGGGGRHIVYRDNAHRDLQREGFILTLDYSDVNLLLDYRPATVSARFQDIQILHNSLEFTPDWKATPVPAGPKREMQVVDFKALEVQGDVKSQAFHERVRVDDLLLLHTSAIKIDGLRDGVLRNIRFEDYAGSGEAMTIGNAPGLLVEDVRLPPAR